MAWRGRGQFIHRATSNNSGERWNPLGRDRRVLRPDSSWTPWKSGSLRRQRNERGAGLGLTGVLECVIHSALFWVLAFWKQKRQYIPVWAKGSLYIEFWTVSYMWATGCNSIKKRIGVFLNTHHHPPYPTPPHHQHLPPPPAPPPSIAPCQPPPPKVQSCWGQAYLILLFLGFQGQKKWLLPFCKWKVTSASAKKAIPLTSLLLWANKKCAESYQG